MLYCANPLGKHHLLPPPLVSACSQAEYKVLFQAETAPEGLADADSRECWLSPAAAAELKEIPGMMISALATMNMGTKANRM